ncbi:MAG: diacylglycerol kinase family protein [Erysipelotrichaceae bacterium]|nr:diacylglycerol kinase family protein [Erysipelotrichaceae bacterium]MDY5252262.1 diacylglycerol kinase family protein [Erysipelotrichaceae bacterium]
MKKFEVAFKGLYAACKHASVMIQMVLALIALIAGIVLGFSLDDMLLIILCIGMVVVSEIFNTAIEFLCDLYCQEYNEKIKLIKDISAGGVLFAALVALSVACLLFFKYYGGM